MFTQSQSNKHSASDDINIPLKLAVLHYCILICIHYRALNNMVGE